MDGKADLTAADWGLLVDRLKFFEASTSYSNDKMIFVVPPGRDFTAFEKLVYPFKLHTWLMVAAFSAVGFFVIFIIKRRSKFTQNFVFGTGVSNPYLNMFIGFIGGSQHILPQRNFARFLLIMFLMCSLISRTLYQGSLFQLMKSNKHHKEVQTIDEMVAKDFRIFVPRQLLNFFQEDETIKSR